MGRVPDDITRRPFTYKCAGCQRTTTLTAAEFNRLPTLDLAGLRALGLEDLALKDLRGAGLTDKQVEQAEAAGVTLAEMHPTLEARAR